MLSIVIDPVTKDFVDDGKGGWLETNQVSTAVMCQLEGEEDAWPFDPASGSRNHEIMHSEVPEAIMLVDSTRRAMSALLTAGLIDQLSVSILASDELSGQVSILIQYLDLSSNTAVDMAYPSSAQ